MLAYWSSRAARWVCPTKLRSLCSIQACTRIMHQTGLCGSPGDTHLSMATCRRLCLLRRVSASSALRLSHAAAADARHARRAACCSAADRLAYTLNRMARSLCCSCGPLRSCQHCSEQVSTRCAANLSDAACLTSDVDALILTCGGCDPASLI